MRRKEKKDEAIPTQRRDRGQSVCVKGHTAKDRWAYQTRTRAYRVEVAGQTDMRSHVHVPVPDSCLGWSFFHVGHDGMRKKFTFWDGPSSGIWRVGVGVFFFFFSLFLFLQPLFSFVFSFISLLPFPLLICNTTCRSALAL